MKKYVVSKTSNTNLLLSYDDLIVCKDLGAAVLEAEVAVLESGDNHFVFEVDVNILKGFREMRAVENYEMNNGSADEG